MFHSQPARAPAAVRIRWGRVGGLVAVAALLTTVLSHRSPASPSSALTRLSHLPGIGNRSGLGQEDGAVPRNASVFDDRVPGVARLDPALLAALRRAATVAADGGVTFVVESGWRSPAYQRHLLHDAIRKYGSEAEAARWVATPQTSAHVSGDAVDIGPAAAAAWLSQHGPAYGLCQIYANEAWHFELRPQAVTQGCPPMYADPTQDPRMQR